MSRFVAVAAVGGVDPSGGAGLGRDVATLSWLGVHAATVVSAVTVQDDDRVHRVEPVPVELFIEQLAAMRSTLSGSLRGIKTGLVACEAHARAIAELAVEWGIPVVCDPLLAAGTGDRLHDAPPIEALEPLIEAASVLTPNVDEAEALAGRPLSEPSDEGIAELAASLASATRSVAVTATAANGSENLLAFASRSRTRFAREARRSGRKTHGTGCAFASALAGLIATGRAADEAAVKAHALVSSWVREARGPGGRLVPSPPSRLT